MLWDSQASSISMPLLLQTRCQALGRTWMKAIRRQSAHRSKISPILFHSVILTLTTGCEARTAILATHQPKLSETVIKAAESLGLLSHQNTGSSDQAANEDCHEEDEARGGVQFVAGTRLQHLLHLRRDRGARKPSQRGSLGAHRWYKPSPRQVEEYRYRHAKIVTWNCNDDTYGERRSFYMAI